MVELYAWQKEALTQLSRAQNSSGIVEVPTGVGKTQIGLEIMKYYFDKRILVVVPTKQLMYQWEEEIIKDKARDKSQIFKIGDGHKEIPTLGQPCVLIAVVNSIRNVNWFAATARFDIFIGDEIHRYGSAENIRFLKDAPFTMRLGITATLSRTDGMHQELQRLIGPIVYRMNVRDAVDAGYIADYDVECVSCQLSSNEASKYILLDSEVKKQMGKFNNNFAEMQKHFKMGPRTKTFRDAMEGLKAIGSRKAFLNTIQSKKETAINLCLEYKDKKIILFDEMQDSADEIFERLQQLGVACVKYHSGISGKKNKKEAIADFISNKAKVLVTVKALDEGLNVKDVEIGIIVNGNSQRRQSIQRLGRILRKQEGKKSKLIMLYVPNTQDEKYMHQRLQHIGKTPKKATMQAPVEISTLDDFNFN